MAKSKKPAEEKQPRRYEVTIARSAFKQLQKLPTPYRERIEERIDALETEPRPHDCEKLTGRKNDYRIRVGMYRIVYSVFDKELVVDVIDVDHRKQVYK